MAKRKHAFFEWIIRYIESQNDFGRKDLKGHLYKPPCQGQEQLPLDQKPCPTWPPIHSTLARKQLHSTFCICTIPHLKIFQLEMKALRPFNAQTHCFQCIDKPKPAAHATATWHCCFQRHYTPHDLITIQLLQSWAAALCHPGG